MEKNKTVASAVSLILVVGVVVGVVALVRTNNDNSAAPETGNNNDINTHSKSVQAVCQNAEDKKLCTDTLKPVSDSDDPKEYIATVVKTSMDSVIKGFNLSDKLTVEHGNSNSSIKMALEDCKDLLQFAIEELQASKVLL